MNVRLLLGLLASGLLCGVRCKYSLFGDRGRYRTNTLNKEGCLKHRVYNRPVYTPGSKRPNLTRKPLKTRFYGRCDRSVALLYFRAKFAVADSGANFHFGRTAAIVADNFTALVYRDAVSASQGRVRT